jgi:hypothetical protein
MKRLLLLGLLICPSLSVAAHQDAERFTHIVGVNLKEYPSLEDLVDKFGHADIVRSGDASTARARICYLTTDELATLVFNRGEINEGFEIRTPNLKDKQRCGRLKEIRASALEVSGVRLGMTRGEYDSLLGKRSKATAKHVNHHFEYVHVLTDEELKVVVDKDKAEMPSWAEHPEEWRNWHVDIYIESSFEDSRLKSFSVSRSEQD